MELWSYVVANWALIAAHPVPFITVFFLALAGGWAVVHFLYRHRIEGLKEHIEALKKKAQSPQSRSASDAVPRAPRRSTSVTRDQSSEVFQPDPQQDVIIEALRESDGHWMSLSEINNQIASKSWQDMTEAVAALLSKGWVEPHPDNSELKEGARSFRLRGEGLAYARAKGYRTAAEKRAE